MVNLLAIVPVIIQVTFAIISISPYSNASHLGNLHATNANFLERLLLDFFLAAATFHTGVVATPATAEEPWGAVALAGWGAASDTAAAFAAAGAASMKLGN